MHPDLVAISNVWQADSAIDRLKAEHEGLTAASAKAAEARARAEAERDAARAALDAVVKAERENGRELDSYVQKRDTTRRMIDQGTAPDYAAAERQLAQCTAKVDELETSGLELLDGLDAARATLAAAEKALAAADEEAKAAKAALAARDPGIRTEMAAAIPRREAAWAELPNDYRGPYGELRRRKRVALVNVEEGGSCAVCHMRIAPQKVNEVRLARGVHTCPGCGGFVLP